MKQFALIILITLFAFTSGFSQDSNYKKTRKEIGGISSLRGSNIEFYGFKNKIIKLDVDSAIFILSNNEKTFSNEKINLSSNEDFRDLIVSLFEKRIIRNYNLSEQDRHDYDYQLKIKQLMFAPKECYKKPNNCQSSSDKSALSFNIEVFDNDNNEIFAVRYYSSHNSAKKAFAHINFLARNVLYQIDNPRSINRIEYKNPNIPKNHPNQGLYIMAELGTILGADHTSYGLAMDLSFLMYGFDLNYTFNSNLGVKFNAWFNGGDANLGLTTSYMIGTIEKPIKLRFALGPGLLIENHTDEPSENHFGYDIDADIIHQIGPKPGAFISLGFKYYSRYRENEWDSFGNISIGFGFTQ